MKEIDFLPVWYKKSRRQQFRYRWQYVIIIIGFVFMVSWSFFAGKVVNNSQAYVLDDGINTTGEYQKYQAQLKQLTSHEALIGKYSSKVMLSAVMAELSFIADESIILNQFEITAEEYEPGKIANVEATSLVRKTANTQKENSERDIIYKVVLYGIATDNNAVAKLLCDLEQSQYFCNVIPGYSKNVKFKDKFLSEFEISCYIANFKEVKQ